MPTTVEEDELELEFDDEWDVIIKWDETTAYRNGIHKLQESKAVDVLAYSRSRKIMLMIEIKDFRRYRIENKPRISNGDLFDEVALKVRDTVAGVRGAARTREDQDVAEIAKKIASRTPLTVLLLLEEDRDAEAVPKSTRSRRKGRRSTMSQELKTRVKWLTTRALVGSRTDSAFAKYGIDVRSRPIRQSRG